MIFLINVVVSCGYLYITKNIKRISFLYFLPIIFLWTFILGFQYGVGTDYFGYIDIYNSEGKLLHYYLNEEFIFFYFIKFLKIFFKNGQIFFVLVSLFENLLFFYYLKLMTKNKLISKRKIALFIFLFLCFGTNFYNQMNGIRQFFNIYLLSIASFYIYNKNILKYVLIFFIGSNIHKSFLLLGPVYIFNFTLKKFNSKLLRLLIIGSFIFNIVPISGIVEKITLFIPKYVNYLEYMTEKEMMQKIVKLMFIPYYYSSCTLIIKNNDTIKQFMLKLGIISYIIKIITLKYNVINRIGEYFTLLAIYPIYLLLEKYIKKKDYINLVILLGIILSLFITKVIIFPKAEYLYKSYLFS